MADSTVVDISKMKVVDLRKELKSRGLPSAGDKAELVARLQAALTQDASATNPHGDITLDSDEIDSDGVLDEDDKSQHDILDDTDTLNEEEALAEQPSEPPPKSEEPKMQRTLKRKITVNEKEKSSESKPAENKQTVAKKIVLNRNTSITTPLSQTADEKTEEKKSENDEITEQASKVKITAEADPKTRLELRAKRFGLPVKMTDEQRKEARKHRFGQNTGSSTTSIVSTNPTLGENIDKLKKRAERFGQSVSKFMTDIENREKLEKRKAKFGTVK